MGHHVYSQFYLFILFIHSYLVLFLFPYFIHCNFVPSLFMNEREQSTLSPSSSSSPAVIDKKRCSFRRGTWRLSCNDVWVIRHERRNNLGATRDLGALTWSRLNYGRSQPAVCYVAYLRLSITRGNIYPSPSRVNARERGWISVSTEARIYERF